MMQRCRLRKVMLAVPAIALAGCFGLPQDLVDLAETRAASIRAERERTDNLEKQYQDFTESPAYETVQRYAERERWSAGLDEARAKLGAADTVYRVEVLPLLERDAPEESEKLRAALQKIPALVSGARDSAQEWKVRSDFLAKVADQPGELVQECESALAAFKQAYPELDERAKEAKRNHAARTEDIDRLTGPLRGLFEASSQAAASATGEYTKIRSGGNADLAVLGDSCEQVKTQWDEFRKTSPEVLARLAELDRSYSRTLVDMKVEYGLVVRRQSWDDAYDYPALHNVDFAVSNVDADTFEHLAGAAGSLATLSYGWLGSGLRFSYGVDKDRWASLGIDPTQHWPRGDNAAEFWVEKANSRYFHKYLDQEDGEVIERPFTEVSEELFLKNVDNLGMEVESKAFGSFESEKLTHAAPPGMAYVGNPHYGRWVSDGSGGSVWNWFGPYLFYRTMFGSPMTYSRSDWNSWSRDYRGSRPYYGGTSSTPRWGSRSQTVRTSPKMRGSTFARGGGFRQASSSVRGAGPSSRGGSFGASGK